MNLQTLLNLTTRTEVMSPTFTKYHLEGLPFDVVLHHFTAAADEEFHDHPFDFTSFILKGGYTERIFSIFDNKYIYRDIFRPQGSVHFVTADTIHKITYLPEGDCWTLILPERKQKEPGFYRFEKDEILYRQWDESYFKKIYQI